MYRFATVTAVILALASCDDPVEPRSTIDWIDIGERVTGSLPADSSARDSVRFTMPDGRWTGVLLEAETGIGVVITAPGGDTMAHRSIAPGGVLWFRADTALAGDWSVEVRPLGAGEEQSNYEIVVVAVDPGPENTADTLPAARVVDDEGLTDGFDHDQFVVRSQDGEYLNVFFSSPGAIDVRIEGPGAPGYMPDGGNVEGRGGYSGRIQLEAGADYRISVSGRGFTTEPIPYRLEVYRTDPAPEQASPLLEPDVAVTEEVIDEPGDFDTFTFEAFSGDMFDVLLASPGWTTATIHDPTGVQVAGAATADAPVLPASSGFFRVLRTGTYQVRVYGYRQEHGGAYSLLLHPVNPAPEHTGGELSVGDSAVEFVDPPTDFDEFRLSMADSLRLSIAVVRPDTIAGALLVRARANEGDFSGSAIIRTSGVMAVMPGGDYNISVEPYVTGYEEPARFTGPYVLYAAWSAENPETTSGALQIGDEITETAQPLRDLDRFHFDVSARSHFRIALRAGGEPGHEPITGYVGPVAAPPVASLWSESGVTEPAMTRRLTAQTGGVWEITLEMGRLMSSWTQNGGYDLALQAYPTEPEHAAAVFAVGDSIADAMDVIGDVDRYVVAGAPHQRVALGLRSGTGTSGAISADAFHEGRPDSTIATVASAQRLAVAVTELDAAGRTIVEVLEHPFGWHLGASGPYTLMVLPFDSAPEDNGVELTRNVPVSESLTPVGDHDEYTIDGVADSSIEIWLGRPAGDDTTARMFIVEVEGRGTILGTVCVGFPSGTTVRATGVTLPWTDTYTVRVRACTYTEDPHTESYTLEIR